MPDNLTDIIERVAGAISDLGVFLPIAIFVIAQLFSGKDDEKKKRDASKTQTSTPQPTAAAPAPKPMRHTPPDPASPGPVTAFPFGPASWMESATPQPAPSARQQERQSQWGHTFEKQDSEKDVLKWGSVFEDKAGEPLRWESAFEADRARNTYGFEGATYGSTFPKKSSEPVVYVG